MDHISPKAESGLRLFNRGIYYEAHEHFEAAWRQTPDHSREFYRALLHISGGFFRLTQDRPEAAKKFFSHALRWLSEFPTPFLGINTGELRVRLHTLIEAIDQAQPARTILQQETFTIPLWRKDLRT